MKAIASYYIKSLFLKKVDDMQDKTYWQNKISLLFRTMVEELYNAISKKDIPFFWNSDHNLIGGLKPTLQKVYCDKLKEVIAAIDANDIEKVVGSLLTTEEMREFKKSEFYQKQGELPPVLMPYASTSSFESSQTDSSLSDHVRSLTDELDSLRIKNEKDQKFEELEDKMNKLGDRVSLLERRMAKLEMAEREKSRTSVADIVAGTDSMRLMDLIQIDA